MLFTLIQFNKHALNYMVPGAVLFHDNAEIAKAQVISESQTRAASSQLTLLELCAGHYSKLLTPIISCNPPNDPTGGYYYFKLGN